MMSQVALTFLTRIARLFAGLGVGVVTARALGPAGRGDYFLVITISALIVQLGQVGLASSNTYLVARTPLLLPRLLVNSVVISFAGGGLLAFTVVTWLAVARPFVVDAIILWPIALLAPVTLFYLLGSNLLVGVGRLFRYNLVEGAATVIVTLSILVAALTWGTPLAVVIGSVIGSLVSALALIIVLGPRNLRQLRFDIPTFAAGWRFAAKSYLVTLAALLLLRVNVFVLERVSVSAALGQFSIASQIAEAIGVFPASVALVLFPRLVRDAQQSWLATLRTMAIVGLGLVVVSGVLASTSDLLITVAFGTQFAPAGEILRLLLPGVISLGMVSVMSQFLGAVGLPLALIYAWAAALILVILLGLILVPVGGASGAAVALSTSYTTLLLMVVMIGFRHRTKG